VTASLPVAKREGEGRERATERETERERETVRKSTLEKYNIKFDEKTNKYISE
jgi:hypothetical protein